MANPPSYDELVEGNIVLKNEIRELKSSAQSYKIRFQNVPALLPFSLTCCDPQLHFQLVNRQYPELYQIPRKMLGKHLSEKVGQAGFDRIRPLVEVEEAEQCQWVGRS